MNDPATIKSALAEEAHVRGFDAFGIVKPDAAPELKARLENYIAGGAHGDMTWLATSAERRASPLTMWPEVRSIAMLGLDRKSVV